MSLVISAFFKQHPGTKCAFAAAAACILLLTHTSLAKDPQGKDGPYVRCWEYRADVDHSAGIQADDTNAYFVSRDRIVSIDLATGQIAWTSEIGGSIRSELLLRPDELLIVTEIAGKAALLRSVSVKTGLPRWNLELGRSERYFLVDAAESFWVVSSRGEISIVRNAAIVSRAESAGAIEAISESASPFDIAFATSKPTIEQFGRSDGKRRNSFSIRFKPARLAAAGTSIFAADGRGTIYSFDGSGSERWRFRTGGRIHYLKALEDGVVVGSADNFVYFFSAGSGNIEWKRRLPGRVASGGIVQQNRIALTVVGEPSAYLLDASDGRIVDQLRIEDGEAFLFTPVKANGIYLLAATNAGVSAWSMGCAKEKGDLTSRL